MCTCPPPAAGSQRVAEKLAADTSGKIFLEDAGFDWKVRGRLGGRQKGAAGRRAV